MTEWNDTRDKTTDILRKTAGRLAAESNDNARVYHMAVIICDDIWHANDPEKYLQTLKFWIDNMYDQVRDALSEPDASTLTVGQLATDLRYGSPDLPF